MFIYTSQTFSHSGLQTHSLEALSFPVDNQCRKIQYQVACIAAAAIGINVLFAMPAVMI